MFAKLVYTNPDSSSRFYALSEEIYRGWSEVYGFINVKRNALGYVEKNLKEEFVEEAKEKVSEGIWVVCVREDKETEERLLIPAIIVNGTFLELKFVIGGLRKSKAVRDDESLLEEIAIRNKYKWEGLKS